MKRRLAMKAMLLTVAWVFVGSAWGAQPVLKAGVKLNDGTDPLRVQVGCTNRHLWFGALAQSAPEGVDWNHDGLTDLLVGQSDGRIQLYLNQGVAGHPVFEGYTYLKVGNQYLLAYEPGECQCLAPFSSQPRMVDFNSDGKQDLWVKGGGREQVFFLITGTDANPTLKRSGSYIYYQEDFFKSFPWPRENSVYPEAYWVDPFFGRRSKLVVDWTGDGSNEWVVGDVDGSVWYSEIAGTISNAANRTKEELGYTSVVAGGVPVKATVAPAQADYIGYQDRAQGLYHWTNVAAVVSVADLDGDGLKDLLVGNVDGYVWYFQAYNTNLVVYDQNVRVRPDEPKDIRLFAKSDSGGALTYSLETSPAHGALSPLSGPNATYTPDPGYSGPDGFTFKVGNGSVEKTGTVSIAVINRAPVAQNQSLIGKHDEPLIVELDVADADGDRLTYDILSMPAHGTLTNMTSSEVTYIPDAGYDGPDGFTFKANDGQLDSNTGAVSIAVQNRAPVAQNRLAFTDVDTAVPIALAATDEDGDPMIFSLVDGPSHGTLSEIAGFNVTYTPSPGYSGPDSFTFKASDDKYESNVGTVTLSVEFRARFVRLDLATQGNWKGKYGSDGGWVVGDAKLLPAYANMALEPVYGLSTTVSTTLTTNVKALLRAMEPGRVVGYLSDEDNRDPYTIDLDMTDDRVHRVAVYCLDPGSIFMQQVEVLDDSGTLLDARDLIGFQNGMYLVWDLRGHVKLRFTGANNKTAVVNGVFFGECTDSYHPPLAWDQLVKVRQDVAQAITLAGADSHGGPLTYRIATPPAHGELSPIAGSNVLYTPDSGYCGTDRFTFTANDGSMNSENAGTVRLAVWSAATTNGASAAGYVYDYVTQGNWKGIYGAEGWMVAGDSTYLPDYALVSYDGMSEFCGSQNSTAFSPYSEQDLQKASAIGYVSARLEADPVILDLSFLDGKTHRVELYMRVNWGNHDLDTYQFKMELLDGETGAVLCGPYGKLGASSVMRGEYLAFDVRGHVKVRTAAVPGYDVDVARVGGLFIDATNCVAPPARPLLPIDGPQSVVVKQDTPTTVKLPATDGYGAPMEKYFISTRPLHGTLPDNPSATMVYTPNAGYLGPDSFRYWFFDSKSRGWPTYTVNITVTNGPVPNNQRLNVTEDTAKSFKLTAVDTGAVTYTVVNLPTNGTLSGTAPNLTYMPAADVYGVDRLNFKINNGMMDSELATVFLTIAPVNDSPALLSGASAEPGRITLSETAAVHVAAIDVDGDALWQVWSKVSGPGTATFAPAIASNSAVSFSAPGVYVLRATVSEQSYAALSVTSDVAVVVSSVPGDLNDDGVVNARDLPLVLTRLGQYQSNATNWDSRLDPNDDGEVRLEDLAFVTTNFGTRYADDLPGLPFAGSNTTAAAVALLTSSNTPAVGETFTVTAALLGAPPFANWGLFLRFDKTKLQLIGQSAGNIDTFIPDARALDEINAQGEIHAGGFDYSDNGGGDGTLGAFTFRALAGGNATVGTEARSAANLFGNVLMPAGGGEILPAANVLTLRVGGTDSPAPTVATPASASPSPVTGASAALSALGADEAGEAGLTYSWIALGMPPAPVTFSTNDCNAAKSVTATFTRAGVYSFQVTIQDPGGMTAVDRVDLIVEQAVTAIAVTPAAATVLTTKSLQFAAVARDQFGETLAAQPDFAWAVGGGGTMDDKGLFVAGGSAGGPYAVTAGASGRDGTAGVTVAANQPPTVATSATAHNNPTTGDRTVLNVLGADDGGDDRLTYTWTATGAPPAPVTYSANGNRSASSATAYFTKAGAYAFQVAIRDEFGAAATGNVNVTVSQAAHSTVVAPDSAVVHVGQSFQFGATVFDQFGDPFASPPAIVWSLNSAAAGTVNANGLFTAGDTTGGPYTLTAKYGVVTGTASVYVDAAGNQAPVAQGQSVTALKDTATNILLVATDADGDPLTYSIVANPTNGTLSGTPPGVTYMPATNFVGNDSFTFKANDGTNDSNVATVSLRVRLNLANQAPVALGQSLTTAEDTATNIVLTATDGDGDPLTYGIVTNPAHGTLSGTAPNVTYTPAANYYGEDSFAFRANDGLTNSEAATVLVTVTAVNDAPAAQSQSVTVLKNTAKGIVLAATDADGDALTYGIAANPAHGSLIGTPPGVTYTPATDYFGADSFTFTASDGSATSAPATVSITVSAGNVEAFAVVDWGGDYVSANQTFQRTFVAESLTDYGGSASSNDARKSIAFSETALLSPAAGYAGVSSSFFGGWNSIVYDVAQSGSVPSGNRRIRDNGANDVIQFNAGKGSAWTGEAAGVVVWMKADFLAGATQTLSLTEICTQRINIVSGPPVTYRLVVKNGTQYYLSSTSRTNAGWLTVGNPVTETWATFNPANTDNRLNDIGGSYASRTFDDVRALGYYWSCASGTVSSATANLEVQDAEFMAAVFGAAPPLPDADADGMDDAWEVANFGSTNAVKGGPADDYDDDGFPNLAEFIAGTSPTNGLSRFEIVAAPSGPGGALALAWDSVTGRMYAVERRFSLMSGPPTNAAVWTNCPGWDNVTGNGARISYTNTDLSRSNLFFRLRVWQ